MNLTLRTRIFVIVSLVVLLILGISVALIVISKNKKQAQEQNNEALYGQTQTTDQLGTTIPINGITPTVIDSNMVVKPETTEEKDRNTAINLAKIFVERYGSYSTENPGQNLKDLEILCTSDLWNVLKKRAESMVVGKEFIGVSTRAFGASFISYDDKETVVRVMTIREENKDGVIRNFNQEAEVVLIGGNGGWLVDDVKWQ